MEAAFRLVSTHQFARKLAGLAFALLQVAPVAAGLAFILGPSFGHLPVLGSRGFSLGPWREALALPGLWRAFATTLISGVPATAISLVLALAIASRLAPWGEIAAPGARSGRAMLQAVIAVPPVALALGFAFVLAPSGWLMRLIVPVLGWERPPDFPVPRDPWGFSLGLALILKETPFLTLAALSALHQIGPAKLLRGATGLGYELGTAWIKVVLPNLLSRMRWPIFAVLAYALSAVDLAILLGPSNPPTLAGLITDLGRDPDLSLRLPGACLALAQIALVALAWALWSVLGRWLARISRPLLVDGARALPQGVRRLARWAFMGAVMAGAAIIAMALASLILWSLSETWRFPDPWPECCSLASWGQAAKGIALPLWSSISLALGATLAALMAAIGYLRLEGDLGRRGRSWSWGAIFVPLVTPDIGFLLGAQILFLILGWRAGWAPVLWAHFLFVFPYVLLILSDPWRRLDPRYERIALCLGAGPWKCLWSVRLTLLRPALALAFALGIAVSLSLYLPTVLLGGGRVATLATEAVALSSGGDRRVIGVYGSALTVLAWAFFAWVALERRHPPKFTES